MRIIATLLLAAALSSCGQPASDQFGRTVEALSQRVAALEDERAVLAVIDALDIAVDAKDWTGARRHFADEINADFSSLGGSPARMSADALIEGWRANLFVGKPSFHLRGAAHVRLMGDAASVTANGYAWNALPQRAENNFWEVWGRYEYELARTAQGWKIISMTFVALHQRGDPSVRSEILRQ